MARYPLVEEGVWFEVMHRGWRQQCCSCGLIHDFHFRVTDRGRVEIKVRRNERATSAARRRFRKKVVIVYD